MNFSALQDQVDLFLFPSLEFILLFYEDRLRLIILSGNMVEYDWKLIENVSLSFGETLYHSLLSLSFVPGRLPLYMTFHDWKRDKATLLQIITSK